MEQPGTDIDLLITGAEVLTFNDANDVLRDGAIAIAGDKIVWLGKSDNAAKRFRAKNFEGQRHDRNARPGGLPCTHCTAVLAWQARVSRQYGKSARTHLETLVHPF